MKSLCFVKLFKQLFLYWRLEKFVYLAFSNINSRSLFAKTLSDMEQYKQTPNKDKALTTLRPLHLLQFPTSLEPQVPKQTTDSI